MRTRLTSLATPPGAICLLAVVLMSVAAVLPFLEAPTYGGLSGCCGPQTTQLVHSLLQGYDAAWVVVILLILGAAAASHLAGIRPRIAAVCCLAASITALAFALFESSNGGSRMLTGAGAFRTRMETRSIWHSTRASICFSAAPQWPSSLR